ncbi:MAG: hypothetical protein EBR02_03685 [Alphaproteobacteria bacterium]|nr:hypothetical protein [Alphaproteobacteria bacterium]
MPKPKSKQIEELEPALDYLGLNAPKRGQRTCHGVYHSLGNGNAVKKLVEQDFKIRFGNKVKAEWSEDRSAILSSYVSLSVDLDDVQALYDAVKEKGGGEPSYGYIPGVVHKYERRCSDLLQQINAGLGCKACFDKDGNVSFTVPVDDTTERTVREDLHDGFKRIGINKPLTIVKPMQGDRPTKELRVTLDLKSALSAKDRFITFKDDHSLKRTRYF